MRGITRIGICALFLAAAASLQAHAGPDTSGKPARPVKPSYVKIVSGMQELSAKDSWVRSFQYGVTPEGRELHLIRIARPDEPRKRVAVARKPADATPKKRPAAIISGSIHGNEYMNIVDRLGPWLAANRMKSPGVERFLDAGGVVYVVPVANPDGYELNLRGTPAGVDLNRTFVAPFPQTETASLARWIDQDLALSGSELELAVDYHCCKGSLIYPWSRSALEPIPAEKIRAHRFVGMLMQHHIDPAYTYGTTSEVLGYSADGTAKDYWYSRYGALSFTYEGEAGVEHTKFDKHTVWWDRVLAMLSDKKRHMAALAGLEPLEPSAKPDFGAIPFLRNLFLPPVLRTDSGPSAIQVEE